MKYTCGVKLSARSLKGLAIAIALLGFTGALVLAQAENTGAQRLFDEGNILYQQDDYQSALDKYRQIEELGLISPALYFNIANSYYKLEQVGRAVLYYERAHRLDPKDDDVQANLEIARQATVDKITPPPEFALASWLRWALYLFPISTLLRTLAVIYIVLAALLITLVVSSSIRLPSALKRAALITLILLLGTTALFLAQWQDSKNRVEAVVLVEELPAWDAPGEGGTELFSIHEGTKVRIEQSSNGSVEIILSDGKIGWVSSNGIEII